MKSQRHKSSYKNHKNIEKAKSTHSKPKDVARARSEAPRSFSPRAEISIPKNWRVIAGHHAIREAFAVSKGAAEELWLQAGWESSGELREWAELAKHSKIKVEIKSESILERLCHSHQGAVLLVSARPELDYLALSEKNRSIFVFLDGIEDPHNLGAIFRTSWLMGVDGIFVPEDRAVGLTATVHKVACGGVEHVPLVQDNQFAAAIERLKTEGYWVFGLSHKAEKSIYEFKLPEKVVWMIGAEDKGLRTSSERLCDELVSIPQVAAAASYNASVAAAMALAETYRQQKGK